MEVETFAKTVSNNVMCCERHRVGRIAIVSKIVLIVGGVNIRQVVWHTFIFLFKNI